MPFGRLLCWVRGHDWALALISFGRTYSRCRRCGRVRYR
jgi:hypothetical protein